MMSNLFYVIFMMMFCLSKNYFWMVQVMMFNLMFLNIIISIYSNFFVNLSYELGTDLMSYGLLLLNIINTILAD